VSYCGNEVYFRPITKVLIMLLLGFISTGCAFVTRHVTLNYPPESDNSDLGVTKATAAAFSTASASQKTIVFIQFNDLRYDKSRIGNVQNGYGMDTADVVAQNIVDEWINNALITELESAGYKIVSEDKIGNKNNLLVLSGEILRVYVTAYFSYTADVSLVAELELNDKVIHRGAYNGEGSVGMNWAMTEESAGESLSLALSDAAQQIVRDIDAQFFLMDNP